MFAWRACHNILPTYEKLRRRQIIEDNTCTICHQFLETAIHALWECGAAQDVWAGCPNRILQKGLTNQGDVLQQIANLMHKLTKEDLELFLVQCWLIWNQRNLILHGGICKSLVDLMREPVAF